MKRNLLRTFCVCVGLSAALLTEGCGGGSSGPPRAPVSGKLTIEGKPVEGVEVHFINPDFPQHGSYAVTNAEGKFRLVQGAAIGTNKVFFSKVEGGAMPMDPEMGMDAGQMEAMTIGNERNKQAKADLPKQLIPAEYADSNSKLTFPVPEGGTTEANFDL